MEIIKNIFDLFLNLDIYLLSIVTTYQYWIYVILFIVIFCETGLIVTPFLPGDSLLFAVGAIAALGLLNLWLVIVLLCIAAFLGDSVNYTVGKFTGRKVFEREYRFINRKHLIRTQEFYDKHGGKTILIARFIPIIRTFAPFIAGISTMNYRRFLLYNLFGGILWILICTLAGYFFGNIPVVKEHFSLVVLAIILLSLFPVFFSFLKIKFTKPTVKANNV